ncbi:alginate export family protein, partial [Vibrio parahaemolyticus]
MNPLDVRQVYVEFGAKTSGWNFRAGRQELIYGEERLVGASNWGNVGRSFDAARLSYMTKSARLDWFGGTVVAPIKGFDRFS